LFPCWPMKTALRRWNGCAGRLGFKEKTRWLDENGVLAHGEIALGDQVIMLAMPSPDYQGQRNIGSNVTPPGNGRRYPGSSTACWSMLTIIQTQYQQAKAAAPPSFRVGVHGYRNALPGGRPGGQRWMFLQMPKAGRL